LQIEAIRERERECVGERKREREREREERAVMRESGNQQRSL